MVGRGGAQARDQLGGDTRALRWRTHGQPRIAFAIARARELVHVGAGDILVVTAGQHQKAGGTDLIRVITLEN
jgi:hypothetical protein